jgi:hypothetical protein
LKAKPEIKVLRSVKVARMNRIEIYLDLTVGLRLVRENFVLTFSDNGVSFRYELERMNSKFTQYKLIINYETTVQNAKLAIKVVSPISQLTSLPTATQSESDSTQG